MLTSGLVRGRGEISDRAKDEEIVQNISNFTGLFLLGADRYGSWPSEMRGVPSLAHIPGAHLSDSCHPHPGQLDPTQQFLYNASLSQRPAQEGQCPPSAPAPGPFLFTLFSFPVVPQKMCKLWLLASGVISLFKGKCKVFSH